MVMHVKADTARTYVQVASLTLSWTDIGTAVATHNHDIMKLPANSRVTGGWIYVDTLFATAGTATLDLGDSSDQDEFTSTICNLENAQALALTLTGVKYTTEEILSIEVTIGTAVTTAGELTIVVEYVDEDRAHEQIPLAVADYSAARGAAA